MAFAALTQIPCYKFKSLEFKYLVLKWEGLDFWIHTIGFLIFQTNVDWSITNGKIKCKAWVYSQYLLLNI